MASSVNPELQLEAHLFAGLCMVSLQHTQDERVKDYV